MVFLEVDFESVSYKEFYENFRYGKTVHGQNFKDRKGRDVCVRDIKKNRAIIRTRHFSITNPESTFMQLLMLHWPTRVDVDGWIDPNSDIKSFREFAIAVLGREKIVTLAPHLSSLLEYCQNNTVMAELHSPEQKTEPELDLDLLHLTVDQLTAFNCIKDRLENVSDASVNCQMFITGAAGTGKSTLLRVVARFAKSENFEIIRLAPSGVAAVNIGGQTIHRWFRIARMQKGNSFIVGNLFTIREQIVEIQALGKKILFLVDEASMISGSLLSTMEETLSITTGFSDERNNPGRFGGLPIIFFGDFGQLGPVCKGETKVDWIWRSPVYSFLERHDLINPCRHGMDSEFKYLLDRVREGAIDKRSATVILEILGKSTVIPDNAVRLMTHKMPANQYNDKKHSELPGEEYLSIAYDNGAVIKDKYKLNMIYQETGLLTVLKLKVGSLVMCTSNVSASEGVVNGTVGSVVGIYKNNIDSKYDIVEMETEGGKRFKVCKEKRLSRLGYHERFQFPLILSWAMTIHKSQSLTLPKAAVSLRNVFTSGQVYVAMSRVRTRDDLYIIDIDLKKIAEVANCVKSRLSKSSEENRGFEDDILDTIDDELD